MNPIEQHIPSVREMMLLTGCCWWWGCTGKRSSRFAPASFAIMLKAPAVAVDHIASVASLTLLSGVLPCLEELVRGLRHRRAP